MVTLFESDILATSADVLVAPVNKAGVAGAGLAKALADRYPDWRESYHGWCRSGCKDEGIFYQTSQGLTIYNGVTKISPYDNSTIVLVYMTVEGLAADAEIHRWATVAVPALGCGLGGLDSSTVIPYLCWRLWDHKTMFHVYLPPKRNRNTRVSMNKL